MTTDKVACESVPGTWRERLGRRRGLYQVDTPEGPTLTNVVRTLREREPGSGLVTAGMVLLGLLDAGLLYVVYAASTVHLLPEARAPAAQVQALALDAAMIIFSVLALGLARKGLGAPAERAAIVVCAAASAFMNWTAADHASLRSVAVYVAAPILLALTTDRTISVVRRHVLGMKDDASPWARARPRGCAGRAVHAPRRGGPQGHPARCEAAILAAAPLPGRGAAASGPRPLRQSARRHAGHAGPGRTAARPWSARYHGRPGLFRERVEAAEGQIPGALAAPPRTS